jgi:hypothetical protein
MKYTVKPKNEPTYKPRLHRRKLLIDPSFQYNFIAYTVGIAIIISAIFFAADRYFFWRFLQQGHVLGLPADHAYFRFLESQQSTLDWVLLLASLIVIVVLIIYGFYYSNRIAGPVYRIKAHLKDYCTGKDFTDTYFRKKDFFPELADSVNEAIRHAESRK